MKVKQSPDDFRVEERTDLVAVEDGPFALYQLDKRDWTTPDAVAQLRNRWRIDANRISFGGLKDRHAATTQYLTIFHGPRRNFSQHGLTFTYLGQVSQAYTSQDIRANQFRIVLRALSPQETEQALRVVEEVRRDGLPNYFDDQRFGSVSANGEFIARLLVLGRFEEALRLALTDEYDFDRPSQKREKEILRDHWGDWSSCKRLLERGHMRDLVEYLLHRPTDFRGAMERLRPELRGLYLSAYQSDIWNRTLALYLTRTLPNQCLMVLLRRGDYPFPKGLIESQRAALESLSLPLASARWKPEADDPCVELVRTVLVEDGFALEAMKVKGSRDLFFSKGVRAALSVPVGLRANMENDERHTGYQKLTLCFELSRGSYATLLIKRIQAACGIAKEC